MSLMSKLIVHAPEQVQTDWALINHVRPSVTWPEGSPSVELGMGMMKGKTATQAQGLIPQFRNPELLDEIARTDERLRVATALLENGRLSFDGYKAILERHGRRRKFLDLISASQVCPLGLEETLELGVHTRFMGIHNDVPEVGLRGAFDLAVESDRPGVLHDLMQLYTGSVHPLTPEASHAEILDLFERYYMERPEVFRDFTVVPTGTESWIQGVPGAYERMLTALVEGVGGRFDGQRRFLANFLLEIPEEVTGPTPDVRRLVERDSDDGGKQAAGHVLRAWFSRRPADAEDAGRFRDVVTDYDPVGRLTGESKLRVTPETLLSVDQSYRSHLCVAKPLPVVLDVLTREEDGLSNKERLDQATELLVHSDIESDLRNHQTRNPDINEVAKAFADRLNETPDSTKFTLGRLSYHPTFWGRLLEEATFRDLAVTYFAGVVLDPSDTELQPAWNLDPESESAVRDLVLEQLQNPDVPDEVWDLGARYELTRSNHGSDSLQNLHLISSDRYHRILLKPQLTKEPEPRAFKSWRVSRAAEIVRVAAHYAVNEYEAGDSTRLDSLIELLSTRENPLEEFRVTDRVVTTERGLVSGICTARAALALPGAAESLAKVLESRFGDDPVRWQLAAELLEDWDGTVPELLEVVNATG